jgi:DNA polymerase III epsilon subunit-like protein
MLVSQQEEIFISVDVETAGPIPGEYSMLSLGACVIDAPEHTFSCEIRPINHNYVLEALKVTGLSLERLEKDGQSPEDAMRCFAEWILQICGSGATPVFVGLNAPFDWSFVNYYFHRFLGENPFGFTAVDIKAYFMGLTGCSWSDTRSSAIAKLAHPELEGNHDALHDARYQAELFRLIRQFGNKQRP